MIMKANGNCNPEQAIENACQSLAFALPFIYVGIVPTVMWFTVDRHGHFIMPSR